MNVTHEVARMKEDPAFAQNVGIVLVHHVVVRGWQVTGQVMGSGIHISHFLTLIVQLLNPIRKRLCRGIEPRDHVGRLPLRHAKVPADLSQSGSRVAPQHPHCESASWIRPASPRRPPQIGQTRTRDRSHEIERLRRCDEPTREGVLPMPSCDLLVTKEKTELLVQLVGPALLAPMELQHVSLQLAGASEQLEEVARFHPRR